jgi:peptidoglycan/LPS O-acetylase OafA/YrhL
MTSSLSSNAQARIPELDGLRGFAVLMVVSIHYFYDPGAPFPAYLHRLQSLLGLGWTGVDLFFVLSGFLIGGILLDARSSASYFQTFYIRRFFRIIPIYYLWIALFMLLTWIGAPYFPPRIQADLRPSVNWGIAAHFLFLQNLLTIHYAPLASWWLSPTWSLAIEEQFYLLAPFLIRFLSTRRLVVFLSFVVFAAPCCRILLHAFVPMPSWPAYTWMPCRADALALGVFGAIFWRDPKFRAGLSVSKSLLYGAFGLLLAGMAILGIWFSNPNALLTQTVGYTWIALFYLSLLFLVLTDTGSPLARIARVGWLRKWGRISYCVYLIHAAVKYFCFSFLTHDVSHLDSWRGVAATFLALAITYTLAKLSWTLFEEPLLRKGQRYKY